MAESEDVQISWAEVESDLQAYEAWARRAREVAHQALFFLGFLYPVRRGLVRTREDRTATARVEEYAPFAFAQVKRMLLLFFPAEGLERLAAADPGRNPQRSWAVRRARQALEARRIWVAIQDELLDLEHLDLDTARVLRGRFRELLRAVRPQTLLPQLREILLYVQKNISLILALLVSAGLLLGVEAVRSLLFDQKARMIGVAALAFAPLLVSRLFLLLRRRAPWVHTWDIGGRAFRSYRAMALEPGRLIDRWPGSSSREDAQEDGGGLRGWWKALRTSLPTVIFRGLLRKAAGYLAALPVAGGILATLTFLGKWDVTAVTLFLVFFLCYAGFVAAHLLDFWDFVDQRPVRLYLILGGLFALAGLLVGWGRGAFVLLFAGAAVALGWTAWRHRAIGPAVIAALLALFAFGVFLGHRTDVASHWPQRDEARADRLESRNQSVDWRIRAPGDGTEDLVWPFPGSSDPVVLMAASGGGSRAAIYTGLTLLRLNGVESRDPKHLAEDAPPEHTADAATERGLREIASNLQAISSVSGGSLANAGYLARLLRVRDQEGLRRPAALEGLGAALDRDFLLPPLLGALYPRGSRGDVIECSWEGARRPGSLNLRRPLRAPKQILMLGLNKLCRWLARGTRGDLKRRILLDRYTLQHLAAGWMDAVEKGEPRPPFPLPLFNSTSLDGHAVVLSPLGTEFYTREEHRVAFDANGSSGEGGDDCGNLYQCNESQRASIDGHRGTNTWVYYRDAVYSLEDLLPNYNPRLSSAVRASANFPFGFPLVTVKTKARLPFNPMRRVRTSDHEKKIRLTDGGALSNSGLWAMFNLLMNEQVADELKSRGVLLVIVEASKMPEYPSIRRRFGTLWRTIGDQTTIGQRMHRLMFDLLDREYGDRIAIHQIDIIPTERYNVLTTWALAQRSVRKLRKSFKERFAAEELVAKWNALKTRQATDPDEPPGDPERIAPTHDRPPLD